MRLRDPQNAFSLSLYLLPALVAWAGWGVGAALLVGLLAALVGIGVRLAVTLTAVRRPDPPLRLHTITFSHYVEKVRWCLDRMGLPYDEVPNAGVLGVILAGRTVPWLEVPPGLTRIADSPRILRYLWGEYAGRLSAASVWFLEPTPAALALEAKFDRRLGNDVRVWVYQRLLADRTLTLRAWGMEERAIPRWQRWCVYAGTPVLRFAVRRMLGVSPDRAERALHKTREAFAEVDAMLADGRRYLTGESLTFADITFASLGALAVLPPEYPGNRLTGRRLQFVDVADTQWRAEIEEFRARPAGQFILQLYRDERARK
jgi:glutathione S-transferase